MLTQPHANNSSTEADKMIKIFQINLNKSEKAHLELVNSNVSERYDIMLIQEPYTTTFNGIRTPSNFRPICSSNRYRDPTQIRSVIWVNKNLDTRNWTIVDVPDTSDITAIQLKGPYGRITIFNVYNDCTHARNEAILKRYIRRHANTILHTENHHMIWAGDFNRHHPLWDDDEDTHLFTREATRNAEAFIELLADFDMQMTSANPGQSTGVC
jgi:endonuclease/exonuclease/phosphatase family metal-dependent hydrolase